MNMPPKRVYALTTVALVIIIALGFWYASSVPVRLIGLKVFEGGYRGGTVSTFGFTGFHKKKIAVNGALSDYASARSMSVAIVRNPDLNTTDVVMVAPKVQSLTTDGFGKAAIAISPDADMVAFATLTGAEAGTFFTPRLSAWTVQVMDIKSGVVTSVGAGFGPEFFKSNDKLMLLFTAPTGITVADVGARTSQTTFFLNPGVIDYAAHISSDGKYLAIPNGLTKHYDLFKVTHIEAPIGLDPLGSAEPVLTHGAFKGDTFYGIERVPESAPRLWRFDMAKPLAGESVFNLPAASIYRVIR